LKIRPVDLDSEYERLSHWWAKRGLPPPPKLVLSGAYGFCAQASGIDVAVGWVLVSDIKTVAISEFVTSNPAINGGNVVRALEALYEHLETFSKEKGCPVLFTSTEVDGSIGRFLEKRGWLPCKGEPHCHLVKACT
jgi:hypothetical protein